jgi:SAM-dependent methyltransferase
VFIKTLLSPFKNQPWFRRLNSKITYEYLAKYVPAEDWHFMNYGYMPNADEPTLKLDKEPLQVYPLRMYHYLALKTQIEGKTVLEVGSGRGGGARHIAATMKPLQYTGLDLAHHAVDLANKIHQLPNLKFIQGSAESLPLADNSVDVVINVESCHAYGDVAKFLSEVKRVLKPGGYFLMVDFRYAKDFELLQQQLRDCGLKKLSEENISDNVVRAIEAEDPAKRERIQKLIPARWQKLFCEFAGVVGSKFHSNLKDHTRYYYRYSFMKPN